MAASRRLGTLHHEYPWKGVAEGIEVARRVKAQNPGLRLVGFGIKPPAGASPYDEFFADLPQGRLAWVYSRCPIYLCPSWDEGLGMPPMEAMAGRRARARTTMAAAATTRIDGRTAVVVPRRDVWTPCAPAGLRRLVE